MLKYFRPRIRSRHPSHNILRDKLSFPLFPFKSVIRLGSFTELENIGKGEERVEINTVDAIKNSADKLRMKECFSEGKVKTADWFKIGLLAPDSFHEPELAIFGGKIGEYIDPENLSIEDDVITYPLIAKHRLGSKGRGNYKLNSLEELTAWLDKRLDRLDEYIFEKFYNYVREYRLHVTEDGYFYACRKMLKSDTPDKDKWYRNDDHCVWIMETNELFDKPSSWDEIVKHSVEALKATGLDFGAVDVKVQSATNNKGKKRKEQEFIIIEINSAPGFAPVTEQKYLEMLPQLLIKKNFKMKNDVESAS